MGQSHSHHGFQRPHPRNSRTRVRNTVGRTGSRTGRGSGQGQAPPGPGTPAEVLQVTGAERRAWSIVSPQSTATLPSRPGLGTGAAMLRHRPATAEELRSPEARQHRAGPHAPGVLPKHPLPSPSWPSRPRFPPILISRLRNLSECGGPLWPALHCKGRGTPTPGSLCSTPAPTAPGERQKPQASGKPSLARASPELTVPTLFPGLLCPFPWVRLPQREGTRLLC